MRLLAIAVSLGAASGFAVRPPPPPSRVRRAAAPPREYTLDDVVFDRFLDEYGYYLESTYEADAAAPLAGASRVRERSSVSVRRFQATRTDVSLRSSGADTRCLLREYGAASGEKRSEALELAARERAILQVLADAAPEGKYAPPPPQVPLLGDLSQAMAESRDALDPDAWGRALNGAAPPRDPASWLVLEWPGTATVATFSVPTAVRVARATAQYPRGPRPLGLPPAPVQVYVEDRDAAAAAAAHTAPARRGTTTPTLLLLL
jgi:hypothetical protein